MLATLMHLILKMFGLIKNPVKGPEMDAPALPDGEAVKTLPEEEEGPRDHTLDIDRDLVDDLVPDTEPEPPKPEPPKRTTWEQRWEVMQEMLDRPFDGPLEALPVRRYPKGDQLGVYGVYGRAPKESGNKKFPKAKLKVHEKLPGTWNKGKPRLYMEVSAGEYFREGLSRCGEMEERITEIMGEQYDVLSYMYSIGSFSHRHIRHNSANQLSYHSWAIAFDQNAGWNRGVTKSNKWQRRIKKNGKTSWVSCTPDRADKGPVNKVLPFSKQFYEVFPKSMPIELFIAFTSVGFSGGMNWGRMKWLKLVEKHGVGYDQESSDVSATKEYAEAIKEWSTHSYYDGMHYELTTRGQWMKALWNKHQALIGEGLA